LNKWLRFFVKFIDGAFRYTKVYFMRDEVAALFKEYRTAVENFALGPLGF